MLGPGSTLGPCVQSTGMGSSAHLLGGTGLAHLDVTDGAYKQTRGMGVSKNTDIAMPPRKEQRTQSRALTVLGSTMPMASAPQAQSRGLVTPGVHSWAT